MMIYMIIMYQKSKIRKGNMVVRIMRYFWRTCTNLDGPILSWQPLFAAIIWFIIAMNILFPLSIIAQATPCPHIIMTMKRVILDI